MLLPLKEIARLLTNPSVYCSFASSFRALGSTDGTAPPQSRRLPPTMSNDIIGLQEASVLLQLPWYTARRLAAAGKLGPTVKLGPHKKSGVVLSRAEVEAYARENPTRAA